MVRAVICDCDGVLLESADLKTRAFEALFRPICPDRVEEIRAYHLAHMGISRFVKFRHIYRAILRRPLTPDEEQELGRRFAAYLEEEIARVPLVPGLEAFISYARQRGYALFVASGTPEEELLALAQGRGMRDWFLEWHGAPKTKPSIIRDILTRHAWRSAEAVFVGDATSDQAAAAGAGVRFVARVTTPDDPLAACRYRIGDLRELPTLLESVEREGLGGEKGGAT